MTHETTSFTKSKCHSNFMYHLFFHTKIFLYEKIFTCKRFNKNLGKKEKKKTTGKLVNTKNQPFLRRVGNVLFVLKLSKAIVIYNSRGGNTRKVANSIAEGLGTKAISYEDITDLSAYELLVVGTWVTGGRTSKDGKQYLTELSSEQLKDKKIVLFITAGGASNPPATPQIAQTIEAVFTEMEQLLGDKIEVIKERIAVQGAFRMFRFGRGMFSIGHPNNEDLSRAKEFGEKLKKYLS